MHDTTLLADEPLISLGQAAKKFPGSRGADRLHPATISRWIVRGVVAPDGRRVRLEALRVGHRWLTSSGALARFADALAHALAAGQDAPAAARTPTQRQRASERAEEELRKLGA